MKKENLRIKDGTRIMEVAKATEYIVDSCFLEDSETGKVDYMPYLKNDSMMIAILTHFIEGYEIEDGDNLYDIIRTDKDVIEIIETFGVLYKDILSDILAYSTYLIEFRKQKILASMRNETTDKVLKFIDSAMDALTNFASLDFDILKSLDFDMITKFISKAADSDITEDSLAKIAKQIVPITGMDKAVSEIVDAKNSQIIGLKAKNKILKKKSDGTGK